MLHEWTENYMDGMTIHPITVELLEGHYHSAEVARLSSGG